MKRQNDLLTCVAAADDGDGVTSLTLVDGRIDLRRRETLEALIRRERLTVVPKSELRAMAAHFVPTARLDALCRPPAGRDDPDVRAWKRVAALQERFRNHGDGWDWFGRFQSCNTADVCLEVLTMLRGLAEQHRSVCLDGLPIDWLGLLRRVMAETGSTGVGTLRAAIGRELEDDG